MDERGWNRAWGVPNYGGGRGLDFATPSPSPILIHGVGNFFAKE